MCAGTQSAFQGWSVAFDVGEQRRTRSFFGGGGGGSGGGGSPRAPSAISCRASS
ncbi:hypothetical protein [Bradyrhizobium japonicum]|uniref:hypothetical protein n=1 Tax=Bradyrhizobium TaxID=374 RepID=UPI00137474F7|nr:hypothetical protein [Bradyrhizobium japonicum]